MGSELTARLLTALVGIPVLLGLVFWAPSWGFALLVAAASAVAVWEFCSITYPSSHRLARNTTIAVTLCLTAVLYLAPHLANASVGLGIIVIWLVVLFSFEDRKNSSRHVAFSVTAFLYGGFILGWIIPLHHLPLGPWWVILTMVTVWASDSGAYFGGSQFGSRALYPSVSPNKSVEGSIAGMVGSLVGFSVCNWAIFPALSTWTPAPWWVALVLAIPANLLTQAGDLAESLFKRAHDVDDSGQIVYGHGGILDRIDGLIFTVPWFYLCAAYGLSAIGWTP